MSVAAFPTPHVERGMTLRDYFAGQAIIGICSMVATKQHDLFLIEGGYEISLSRDAYAIADAMLKERTIDRT